MALAGCLKATSGTQLGSFTVQPAKTVGASVLKSAPRLTCIALLTFYDYIMLQRNHSHYSCGADSLQQDRTSSLSDA